MLSSVGRTGGRVLRTLAHMRTSTVSSHATPVAPPLVATMAEFGPEPTLAPLTQAQAAPKPPASLYMEMEGMSFAGGPAPPAVPPQPRIDRRVSLMMEVSGMSFTSSPRNGRLNARVAYNKLMAGLRAAAVRSAPPTPPASQAMELEGVAPLPPPPTTTVANAPPVPVHEAQFQMPVLSQAELEELCAHLGLQRTQASLHPHEF
mmetsp:Transcript_21942/g.43841  ORF Transcript_21942/g.43841 Transcript_21942/m.43841 type:complete len:204 (+) Transcript_21942:186-797(+)